MMEEKIEKPHDQESEDDVDEYEEELIFKLLESNENIVDIESKSIREDEKMVVSSNEMKLRKKKALLDFRCMVEDAILGNYVLGEPHKSISKQEIKKMKEQLRDITLWGVPLLPSKSHESTDNIFLKFLKAKEFKAEEAFDMLQKTLKWRREYKTDTILDENLNLDVVLEKILYINSVDKQGRPLYYTFYGAFKDKGLYRRVLGTEEDREKFLRWRVQFMEKSIKKLSFKQGEADSMLQIIDFKNSGSDMKELRAVTKKAFLIAQANYPEIIHKTIMINVPFWHYTSHLVSSKIMNHRTKGRYIIARPSKVTQTLLKYISPENLPVEYGGLKRENDVEFSSEDVASELIVRTNSAGCIKIPVSEAGVTMVWDFTVVGWEVTCKEEFIPDDEGSYRILLRKYKEKKMGESVRNSFYISEPGKIVITIENTTLKKRKIYYRSKSKPYVPTYMINKK
ncbi:patellin-4-like [Mercurialis annua]|uniref:patellin-4-like n=1 Tax=Mercurialis annua TaxID=3986 RepID=UPI0021608AF1|nr:patellin-4-like [Mercurialis annua]XP_055962477.1 patellin-4-like [Mercurialis annua]